MQVLNGLQRTRWSAASLLFVLALAVRLYGIGAAAPQTDEITWTKRAHDAIAAIKQGHVRAATEHLGHPGIPPLYTMAAGQLAAARYNRWRGLDAAAPGFIDNLTASRTANAFAASLVPPLLFLFSLDFFGPAVGLLAGLLAATDVHLAAYARIAHVDSALVLFAVACIFLYAAAVRRKNTALKLLAGVCWGLCMAVKPSAVCLIPVFAAYKFLRSRIYAGAPEAGERAVVVWSDLWAVAAGHVVLSVLWGRFWIHESDFFTFIGIKSLTADLAYAAGLKLQQHLPLSLLVISGLACGSAAAWRAGIRASGHSRRRFCHHAANFCGLAAAFGAALTAFPQVIENIVRFWVRTAGFRNMVHKAHGTSWAPPPLGYAQILSGRPSTLLFAGILFGIILFLVSVPRLRRAAPERAALLVLMLLTAAAWPVLCQFSPKQAFRYVLPIFAPLCLIAAYGLVEALQRVLQRLRFAGRFAAAAPFALLFAVLLHQAALLAAAYPDYVHFHNLPSGGLRGDLARGGHPWLAGINEALHFLHGQAAAKGRLQEVSMIADQNTLEYTYRRLYPTGPVMLKFLATPSLRSADYVFFVPALRPVFGPGGGCCEPGSTLERVFAYEVDGVSLTEVYRVVPYDFSVPEFRGVLRSFRQTGRTIEASKVMDAPAEPERKYLAGFPGQNKAGYIFFYEKVHFQPGQYQLLLHAAAPKADAGLPRTDSTGSAAGDAPVVRFEVGDICSTVIRQSSLEPGRIKLLPLDCRLEQQSFPEVRAFWFGKAAVVIAGFEVRGVQRAPENHSAAMPVRDISNKRD